MARILTDGPAGKPIDSTAPVSNVPRAEAPRAEDGRLPEMEVRDLVFSYGNNKVLKGVNLLVEQGKVTCVLGPNGCGKSTLFALMTKNLQPNRGKVFLRGKNIANMSLKDFARSVSIVHQNNTASDDMTVEELVELGRAPYRKPMTDLDAEDERLVNWALEVTGASEYRDRELGRLSGGQRQRVWIAMALAQSTDILFLDEPTTYLDVRYQIEILELVRRLNREFGMTIVMVLHDINQAIAYSDVVVGLKGGRVAFAGDPNVMVTHESMRNLFGVNLKVEQADGAKYVILRGDGDGTAPITIGTDEAEADDGLHDATRTDAPNGPSPDDEAQSPGRDEPEQSKNRLARLLWTALGVVCFGLGTLGTVLPILPTVPLYLGALFCFAKGSKRLHDWFVNTNLYHKHLEDFVDHRGMTMRTKLSVIGMVTVVMGIAFALMGAVPVGRVILVVVWLAHIVYFMGFVKTDKPGEEDDAEPDVLESNRSAAQANETGAKKNKGGGGMIKTRLIELLSHARMYIVYQVLWQWAALICQIGVIFIVTNLLRLLLGGHLTVYWMTLSGVLLAVLLVVRFWCDRRATFNSFAASVDVKRIIRGKIYDKLLRLGASYKEHVSTAEVVQMSVEGAEQLETYFGKYLSQLFYSLVAPLTLFAALVWYNWQASLVLLVCVPLIPVVIMVVQKIARKLLNKYWDVYTGLGDNFLENLQGLTTLKIYRADAQKAVEMDEESERFRRITMKVLSMQLNSIIIMDVVAYGGAAVGMAVAIWQFMQGNVDVAGVLMIILLSSEFFIPMRLLGSFFHIAMNGMAASDKMFAFLDIAEREPGTVKLDGSPVGISLESVAFGYDDGAGADGLVLDGVSMQFPPGSFVSLVGESGCGKSTVAKIIMGRNRGYSGTVELGGVELSDVDEASLAANVTMVTNDSYLFKGTVMENLSIGNPNAGRSDMHRVLEAVNLAGYLEAQDGLETMLEEGGSNLSGGQRQRLALARALLHDSPCYIFDEATSNIDAESEEDIMRVVRELARTKTVVLISHRLANVVTSDCIYLLAEGKVAESGTHDELMKSKGAYARLYSSQRMLETYGREAVA